MEFKMPNITPILALLWTDRATVSGVIAPEAYGDVYEADTRVRYSDIPCKLSFSTLSAAGAANPAAGVTQGVKLFLSKDVEIKPGSKIDVIRAGCVFSFAQSGIPGVFFSHQEIDLVPWERRA